MVFHCLKVFCDKTAATIKTQPLLNEELCRRNFHWRTLKSWKTSNCIDVKTNPSLKEEVLDVNDENLISNLWLI